MIIFNRTTVAAVVGGQKNCVDVPAPTHGRIVRLTVKQVAGTPVELVFTLFNRRGACANETDLNTPSGFIDSIADDGNGKALVTFTEETAFVRRDTEIEIKACSQTAYNGSHVVLRRVSPTEVVLDTAFGQAASDGLWQIAPSYPPTEDPIANTIIGSTTVTSGQSYNQSLNIPYANGDNQDATSRRRSGWLYLEVQPAGVAEIDIQVSIQVEQAPTP